MENPSYALPQNYVLHGDKDYYDFRFLNKGGYGITYLANATFYDGNIKQTGTYAIKEYFPSDLCQRLSDRTVAPIPEKKKLFDESYMEFKQEGELLNGLSHQGIVPVNEVITANGTIYYVMSYLGGTSLTKYIQNSGGKLQESEALRVMDELLMAVGYLHAKQLNHLDIKPDNVMMEQGADGRLHPVLIDFGLSKHFKPNGKQTSRLGGKGVTDGFSPLEQYAGISTFSPQADIYALGATFFNMLTGVIPLKANEVSEQWIRKNLPKNLDKKSADAICKAMQRDVNQRTSKTSSFFGGTASIKDNWDDPTPTPVIPYKKIAIGVVACLLVVLLWKPLMNLMGNDGTSSTGTSTEVVDPYTDTDQPTDNPEDAASETTDTGQGGGSTQTSGTDGVTDSDPTSGSGSSTSNPPNTTPSQPAGANGGGSQAATNSGGGSDNNHVTSETSDKPREPVVTTGTKDLGYATYTGELKNGQPDGDGALTFHSSHAIDSRANDKVAESGDVVTGKFKDGHLVRGTWAKASGGSQKVMIGEY